VIERQLLRPVFMLAILARVPITSEDVDTGKLDGAMTVFQLHQLEQAHDGGELDGDRDAVNLAVVDFKDFNLALPEKRDRFLPMDDTQRFVRGVEQKGHFHSTTSFPTEAPSVRRPGIGLGTLMYLYAISPLRNQALSHVRTSDRIRILPTRQMDQVGLHV